MSNPRELAAEVAEGVLDFFEVTGSTAEGTGVSVVGDVDGTDSELAVGVDRFGVGAVLERPTSGAQAVAVRLGDEVVVVGTREPRWELELADGEVVVRAYGSAAAAIKLKPDGSIELTPGSAAYVALATLVDARLSAIKAAFDTHVHVGVTAGGASSGIPAVALPAAASVAATKVRAT